MPPKVRKMTVLLMAVTGVFVLLFAQWWTNSYPLNAADSENLTNPLPGLTVEEGNAFAAGLEDFLEVETVEDGLGPVFNGKSCAECHAVPSVGGWGANG